MTFQLLLSSNKVINFIQNVEIIYKQTELACCLHTPSTSLMHGVKSTVT